MDVIDPERKREGDAADPIVQFQHSPYDRRPVALLTVENVTRRFGGIVALDDVSLALDEGTIAGLIGPNGAGKTTLFNVVTRLYKPDTGRVDFDGRDLLKTRPYRVIRSGVARTFQNVVLFPTMTVAENILVGAHTRLRPFGERRGQALAHETLDYLSLAHLENRPAAGLPFGTLKRIELPAHWSLARGSCFSTSPPGVSTTRRWASSAR